MRACKVKDLTKFWEEKKDAKFITIMLSPILKNSSNVGVGYVKVNPGCDSGTHQHRDGVEEVWYVTKGKGTLTVGNEDTKIEEGMVLYGEPGKPQYDFKGYKILTPGYGNMAVYKEDRVYDFLCKISENGSYDMSFDAETDREGDLVLSVASQKAQVTFYKDNFTKFLGDSRECVLEKSSFIQKVQESPAGGEVVPLDFNKMYAALFSGNPALKTKAQGEFRSSGQAGLKFLKKKLSEADSEERWLIEAVISTVK